MTGDVLVDELERLQGLVDDLLLLARGDEQAFARAPFSIADTVRDIGSRTRRVPVDVSVGDDVDPVVGDAGAVGPGPRPPRQQRRPPRQHARCASPWPAMPRRCASTSTTTGLASRRVRRADVVKRFVRLDEGRARDGGGAGLGLAVTSDVAAAHGGRLDIGEAPIGGARLTLVLPRRPPPG